MRENVLQPGRASVAVAKGVDVNELELSDSAYDDGVYVGWTVQPGDQLVFSYDVAPKSASYHVNRRPASQAISLVADRVPLFNQPDPGDTRQLCGTRCQILAKPFISGSLFTWVIGYCLGHCQNTHTPFPQMMQPIELKVVNHSSRFVETTWIQSLYGKYFAGLSIKGKSRVSGLHDSSMAHGST